VEISETYEALWNRALWYLGRRDYGTRELRQKLLTPRPNKPPPARDDVEAALRRLTELGLLDDQRRAERLAESLQRKGIGARRIQMEMRQRGLPEIEGQPGEDQEQLTRLLRTKYAAKLQDERGRAQVFQAMMRRGFSCADIQAAMQLDAYSIEDFD